MDTEKMKWASPLGVAMASLMLSACGGDCLQFSGCDDNSNASVTVSASSSSVSTQAAASLPKSGTGATVFNLPSSVKFIKVDGSYTGSSSLFNVVVGGSSKVFEYLGTDEAMTNFSGTISVKEGGLVEVRYSTGVSWTVSAFTPP